MSNIFLSKIFFGSKHFEHFEQFEHSVSDDSKDILEKVVDDGDDIFEKVSDDAKDILVLTMKH